MTKYRVSRANSIHEVQPDSVPKSLIMLFVTNTGNIYSFCYKKRRADNHAAIYEPIVLGSFTSDNPIGLHGLLRG
jgi:hypothetical protein